MTKERGLTLIELIITIALVGVLVSVVIGIVNPVEQLKKGRDGRRKSDLAQIQRGLEIYYQDAGRYPASTGGNQITGTAWGTAWSPYMSVVPRDPTAAQTYIYYSPVASNGQTYYIYASLERGSRDVNTCNAGAACVSATAASLGNSCGGTCNYGVSSPNVTP